MSGRLASITAGLPRTYWLLWEGTLINHLGGFVVPFLTLYLTRQRGLPVSQAALMASLFGGGSFTAALIVGELTDRIGRRPVMLPSSSAMRRMVNLWTALRCRDSRGPRSAPSRSP